MSTQTFTGTLELVDCPNCGMAFGVTAEFERRRRGDGTSFYCPHGHPMSYTANREAKLARELKSAKETAEWHARRAASAVGQAERAEYRRRAAVGQVTKIKRRVSKGVCPVCTRTFGDLARHMAGQHPEFGDSGDA